MRPLPAKKVIQVLRDHGYILMRQRGSHQIFKQKNTGTIVPVPLHGKQNPIYIGTLKAIIKQSKIPPDRFI